MDEVTSIYDGDTFRVNINAWPAIVGVADVDAITLSLARMSHVDLQINIAVTRTYLKM